MRRPHRNDGGHTVAPPKVVYLGHVARLSGAELALENLIAALGERVEPVVVLAEPGPLVDRLRARGVDVRVLAMRPRVRDLHRGSLGRLLRPGYALQTAQYVVRLLFLVRAIAPDLVHTNTLKAALYGGLAARLAGLPVVWHVRDRLSEDYLPGANRRLVHAAAGVLPTAIVVNSAATLAALPGRARPAVVVFDPLSTDSMVVRRVGGGPVTIGMAGRLAAWKGQDLFLQAFADAFPAGAVRAVIIGSAMFGEDDYGRSLNLLADELGILDRVEFRGFRTDMNAELARLDILVHYSRVPEPWGQVVAQGMAAGLCVLAAAEGGPLEMITHEVDGVLVPPRSVPALARALRVAAADSARRRRLAAAAPTAAARYASPNVILPLLSLYDNLLE